MSIDTYHVDPFRAEAQTEDESLQNLYITDTSPHLNTVATTTTVDFDRQITSRVFQSAPQVRGVRCCVTSCWLSRYCMSWSWMWLSRARALRTWLLWLAAPRTSASGWVVTDSPGIVLSTNGESVLPSNGDSGLFDNSEWDFVANIMMFNWAPGDMKFAVIWDGPVVSGAETSAPYPQPPYWGSHTAYWTSSWAERFKPRRTNQCGLRRAVRVGLPRPDRQGLSRVGRMGTGLHGYRLSTG